MDQHLNFESRISRLEAKFEDHEKDKQAMEQTQDNLQALIDEMRQELARYRGFWGGALLVITAVWTFLTFAWEGISRSIKGEG